MKKFILVITTFLILWLPPFGLQAGQPMCSNEVVTYSPANPVVGQKVTFVICGSICYDYSLDPDAVNDPPNLIPATPGQLPNEMFDTVCYTFTAPGTYHVGLDRVFNERCGNVAALQVSNWFMGPEGGTPVQAVMIPGTSIFCVPITIAAAPGPGSNIPTLGQWGLLIISLLFVISGIIAMRIRSAGHA